MPEQVKAKESLQRVAGALRTLHLQLLRVVRADYEGTYGPIGGAVPLLNLVMNDPHFAWLHALSSTMADIDDLVDSGEIEPLDSAAVRSEVERLVSPREGERGEFGERYLQVLQEDPDTVLAHGRLRAALAELPEMEIGPGEGARIREIWVERRRARSRER